ncbi:MAG: hypothetical protein AABY16_01580 [Nanoarchaeota archaeon]
MSVISDRIRAYLARTKPDFHELLPGEREPTQSPMAHRLDKVAYWCLVGGIYQRGERKPMDDPNNDHTLHGRFIDALICLIKDPNYCGDGCNVDQATNRNGYVQEVRIIQLPVQPFRLDSLIT